LEAVKEVKACLGCSTAEEEEEELKRRGRILAKGMIPAFSVLVT
jgi:hypothetical protein